MHWVARWCGATIWFMPRACFLIVGCVVLLTACQRNDDVSWTPTEVEIVHGDKFEVDDFIMEVATAPSGDRFAVVRRGEMCVESLTADIASTCAEVRSRPFIGSVSWSSDASRFAWSSDVLTDPEEPTLSVFDVEDGVIDVIDSGTGSSVDVAPFFGPDDELYAFRSERFRDRAQLVRIGSSGDVDAIGSVGLPENAIVQSAPRPIGDGRWVLAIDDLDGAGSSLVLVDLDEHTVDMIDLDEPSFVVDATDTHLLLGSFKGLNQVEPDAFSLLSLEDGQSRPFDGGVQAGEFLMAVGFSPDGSFVVAAIDDPDNSEEPDARSRLVGLPVDGNRLGDPVVIARAEDLGIDSGEPFDPAGVVGGREILWNPDGALVLSVDRRSISVLDTRPS